jgi:hypothetical protein
VRALRAGREKFDPFGERSSSEEEEEDDLADVEEPEDDGTFVTASAMKVTARFEKNAAEAADAAFDLEAAPGASAPKRPPLVALTPAWETPCEQLYEDDDAEASHAR